LSVDLNIEQFVSSVQHSRSRSQNPSLVLKPSYFKTSTFQALFLNRVVKHWNYVCKIASTAAKFASLVILNASCTRHTPTWSRILLMWICHALGHSHATTPAIVPKLHYVYIFTVNRSSFFFFLFVLLFRSCALHGSRFQFALTPLDVQLVIYNFYVQWSW
jgi:hypothetical protein